MDSIKLLQTIKLGFYKGVEVQTLEGFNDKPENVAQ